MFLYYNGNYDKKSLKHKNFIFGTKIVWAHISLTYRGRPNLDSLFYKKINLVKKNWEIWNFWFLLLQWTSMVVALILNLKFQKKIFIKLIFFYKTDYLSLTYLYMWVKYELIRRRFSAKKENVKFSDIFPIVIPIVIQKRSSMPQNSSYKLKILIIWSIW